MDLTPVKPAELFKDPEKFIPEFLINIILRSSFDRKTKNSIGWMGLKVTETESNAFTSMIDSREGVYGIDFAESGKQDKAIEGTFNIYYFPEKDEELLEVTAIGAAFMTQEEGYSDSVRDFSSQELLKSHFYIGSLNMRLAEDEKSLSLSCTSPSHKCLIPVEGIINPMSEKGDFLIKPGDFEEKVPAAMLCSIMFDAIVKSAIESTAGTLAFYRRTEHTGSVVKYNKNGESMLMETPDERLITESVTLGSEAMPDIVREYERTALKDITISAGQEEFNEIISRFSLKDKRNSAGDGEPKPELIIISGFLGSGKSTLLANMIEHFNGRNEFVAVIQNELGEVSVDTRLIQEDYSVIEMDEGCVCCSLIGHLEGGLKQLKKEFNPAVIILETTGAANPSNILGDLDQIETVVDFRSLVTIVDTASFLDVINEFSILKEQVKYANTVILNKIDLCEEDNLLLIKEIVKEVNSSADIIESDHCRVNPEVLFKTIDVPAPSENEEHHNHSRDGIESVKIDLMDNISREKFKEALSELDSPFLRIKGMVKFDDSERHEIFQYVSGVYDFSDLGETLDQSFLIFLGKEVNSRIPESISRMAL